MLFLPPSKSHHFYPCASSFLFLSVYLSCHTTHTTTAERRAERHCRRRGADSGQKTKRGIEGEDPAAAGIEGFFSLKRSSFSLFLVGRPCCSSHPRSRIISTRALLSDSVCS